MLLNIINITFTPFNFTANYTFLRIYEHYFYRMNGKMNKPRSLGAACNPLLSCLSFLS